MRIVNYTERLCAGCGKRYKPKGATDPCCSLDCRLIYYMDRGGGPDACWRWLGALNRKGYGTLRHEGRTMRVHRIMYLLDRGYLPQSDDAVVRHTCDHPWCCNPKHLRVGSHHANSRDMSNQGRGRNGASAKVKGYVSYERLGR